MDDKPDSSKVKLLSEWTPSVGFKGHHEKSIDVTGGIFLKVERAVAAAVRVPAVWFVDGRHADRVVAAACGGKPIGTRIRP
jgi:isopentenyl phosphate kinase